jgi:hypothetical protein
VADEEALVEVLEEVLVPVVPELPELETPVGFAVEPATCVSCMC